MSDIHEAELRESDNADLMNYRPVCGLAVSGLVLSFFALFALMSPLLWAVPVVSGLLSALGLRRITKEAPGLVGRKAALLGLFFSVLFGTIAVGHWVAHRHLVDREARQFAAYWFEALRENRPLDAYLLSRPPASRETREELLAELPGLAPHEQQEIRSYVVTSVIQSLLLLGDRVEIRYYDTEQIASSQGSDRATQVYVASCDVEGRKASFFLRLTLERKPFPDLGRSHWRIIESDGPVWPKSMGPDPNESA